MKKMEMSSLDQEEKIKDIVVEIRDEHTSDHFPYLNSIELSCLASEQEYVSLVTSCNRIDLETLLLLKKLFGTDSILFEGSEETTYPYSDYTPIVVERGIIRIYDYDIGEKAEEE